MIEIFKAAILDLDGVITDTADFHYNAWKRLADEQNIQFDRSVNEQLKGVERMASLEIILHASPVKYTIEQKEEMARRKNSYYQELLQNMTPCDLLPKADKTLKALRKLGIKTALASASRNAPTVIERLKIGSLFDYIVDVCEIKKNKPDPEIFLNAAAHLGVQPQKAFGVEDAFAGIEAIKAAGMYAIGIGNEKILYKADTVYSGLEQFYLNELYDI